MNLSESGYSLIPFRVERLSSVTENVQLRSLLVNIGLLSLVISAEHLLWVKQMGCLTLLAKVAISCYITKHFCLRIIFFNVIFRPRNFD